MSKTNINRFGLKFVMLLVFALCAKVAMAQNSVKVEDFVIDSYSTYDIPVLMDNDEAVYGVQFDIVLPDELVLANTPYMAEGRCSIQYQSLNWNPENKRVMIISPSFQPIKGNEGAVAYIPVKLAFGAPVNTTYTVELQHITIQGTSYKNQSASAEVTVVPGIVTGYAPEAEILVNPGESFQVPFAFTNTCNVAGFQVNVNVPAGFTIDTNATTTDRIVAGSTVFVSNNDGYSRVVVANLGSNLAVKGNEGVLFYLTVTAPEEWDGDGVVTFSGLDISYIAGQSFMGTGYNVKLANGKTAYTAALAEVEALKAALDAKLAEIAQTYPDIAEQITGAAVLAKIDALKDAIDAAYADHTLTANYENILAPVASIYEAIEALDAEAIEAQRVFNNLGEYGACNEAFNWYQEKLDEVKTILAQKYPEAKVDALIAAAQDLITNGRVALEAAKKACETEGNFQYEMPVEAIETAINAILEDAQRQYANFDEEAAYAEQLAWLQQNLNETAAAVAEQYPDADLTAAVAAVQTMIDEANAAFEAAKEECVAAGNFKFDWTGEAIENATAALYNEAQRQYANNEEYAMYNEVINFLQEELDNAIAYVAENCPVADMTEQFAAVQTEIEAAKEALEAAKEACAAEGNFKFDWTGEAIENEIAAIKAEADRLQNNANEYASYTEVINFLQENLNETVASVKETYPLANITAEAAAVQTLIDEAKAALEAAKEACATEGNFQFDFSGSEIEAATAALVTEAQRQYANMDEVAAYEEQLAWLQQNLNETVASVAEQYPDANITAEVAAVQALIDEAKAALEAAKEACAEEGTFQFDFSGTEIETATAALVTEAQRQYANKDAAAEYGAMIAAAQEMLDEAKATVAEQYPDANVTALVEAAQAMINQANADLDAAKEACAAEGNFHFDFDMMPIENAINKIVPEAKRQSDNAAAYAEYNAMLEAAQQMLNEAKATVAEEFPGVNVKEEVAAAQALINQSKADLEAAKEACAAEGNFHFDFDMMTIENAINEVLAKAQVKADVQSKYNAAVSAIDALQSKLETTKITVAIFYDDVDIDLIAADAQAAITKAYNDAQAAFEAAATSGTFDYTVPTADIEALIAAIATEAKRQSENTKAYEADKATLAALEEELNKVLNEVTTQYPDAAVLAETLAAQKAITDAYAAVEEAYAAVANEGKYTSPVDAEAIKALIDEIMAKASGIDEVLVEELGGDVKFYNLSGIQVKHPAAGSVVIAVGANGQTRKILVK